jgi:diketogulonate reductase-like aldo/keto reductase
MISWQEGWKNLETLQEKHQIKAIGVSNFDMRLLNWLALTLMPLDYWYLAIDLHFAIKMI